MKPGRSVSEPVVSSIPADILGSDNPKDYSLTLAKGLAILELFSEDVKAVTLQGVADHLSTSRATARRLIMTLEIAGYVEKGRDGYTLSSKCLAISRAYLGINSVLSILGDMVRDLAARLECPCSLVSLDRSDVMFLCRDPSRRVYASRLALGDRLPAHASAGGKLLLANLADDALRAWFGTVTAAPLASRTIQSYPALLAEIRKIRKLGYAVTESELEEGVLSLAVPVRDNKGTTTMALITSSMTTRTSLAGLIEANLETMKAAAEDMSQAFGDFLRHNA
ncbi:hypothetical protein CVM52_03955 [Pseudooceanicola lipolyticus]|uniref:IclR family transcriptional regulator n=1 Tax=Pseudooceanicola lipolyticus TaxID=2029104 RepID=A0A2M8J581_9RHOB|nr:hypothetical protein CVM52_03955 [Pseudooceanicola lipolyticus]